MKPAAKAEVKKVQTGGSKKLQLTPSDIKPSSVKSLGIRLTNHNETLLVA